MLIGEGRGPTVCPAHPADPFTEETVHRHVPTSTRDPAAARVVREFVHPVT